METTVTSVCLRCLVLLRRAPRANSSPVCNVCGREVDVQDSRRVVARVSKVILRGYVYAQATRLDREKNRSRAYSLALPDVLVFIGLAAASAVVGELTLSTARSLMRRIRGRRRRVPVVALGLTDYDQKSITIGPTVVGTFMLTDHEMERLLEVVAAAVLRASPSNSRARRVIAEVRRGLRGTGMIAGELSRDKGERPRLSVAARTAKKLGAAHAKGRRKLRG